jgi:hypothetical protein
MTNSFNLSQGVCTTEISFNDEDLLFGSKLHKQYFYIKRYIDEKMMNCILMDNDLTINILPFKIIKELEIYIYVYIQKNNIVLTHTHIKLG